MTDLFLDCEWADVLAADLVSMALVSLDGEKQFYAEREVLPADPTPWVSKVVYPLLDRGASAMSDEAMSNALRNFLDKVDCPHIYYDFEADRALCQYVLNGFERLQPKGPFLVNPNWHLLTDTGPAVERWWSAHPDFKARRHHALMDATALRSAWLSLWGI